MKEEKAKILFKDWAYTWLEEYKRGAVKANTFKQTYQDMFRLHLLPQFGEIPLDELTKREVDEYLKCLSNKYSNSVLQKLRLCILGMYTAAIEKNICTVNPAIGIKVKSLIEKKSRATYTPIEVEKLFDYAKYHKYGLGICILLETGLRCSEMLGLKWGDIDFHGRCIFIKRASVTIDNKAFVSAPKTKSSVRCLPISTTLCETLKRAYASKTSEYIVPRPNGEPYGTNDYLRYRYNPFIKEATTALSIPRLTSRELRCTRATNLYANSGDIYAVSKYLGHSSVDTTDKFYIRSSPETLRARLGI